LAGVPKPKHVEFQNILPVLAGEPSQYTDIYGAYLELQRSIRSDKYKLIVYPKANALRLYDIVTDPLEQNDLIDDPSMKQVAKDLFDRLIALQRKMNDGLDLSGLAPSL
jgi:choline-sulfatase